MTRRVMMIITPSLPNLTLFWTTLVSSFNILRQVWLTCHFQESSPRRASDSDYELAESFQSDSASSSLDGLRFSSESSKGQSDDPAILESMQKALANTLIHLDQTICKYYSEEKNTHHLIQRVLMVFEKYGIPLKDCHQYETFLVKMRELKDIIPTMQDVKLYDTILKDVREILMKEELSRLAIYSENNNHGHLALGGSNNIEFLENIRIHLHDDTSKNFMVSVHDTTSELMQRIIGKISCLQKDLSEGYSVWEVPHGSQGTRRKLMNGDFPVVVKRSWRRPSKFYFLSKKEEEERFPTQESKLILKDTRKSRPSSLNLKPNSFHVRVYYKSKPYKSFLLRKDETYESFKRRTVYKMMGKESNLRKSLRTSGDRGKGSAPSSLKIGKSNRHSDEISLEGFSLSLWLDNNTTVSLETAEGPLHDFIKPLADGKSDIKIWLLDGPPVGDSIDINLSKSQDVLGKRKDQLQLEGRQLKAVLKAKENTKKISLTGLSLEEIPEDLRCLHATAISIDFGNNRLTQLPHWMGMFDNVKILNLSGNRLNQIPTCVTKMVKLSILDISQNEIKSIDPNVFENMVLKSLYMSHNKIHSLTPWITKLLQLEELTLSGNGLKDKHLDLSMKALENLRVLDISSNLLTVVPPFIAHLNKVEELYMSTNQIAEWPESLYHMTSLRTLDVSHNRIIKIPEGISKLVHLQELLCEGNDILATPIDEFDMLESLSIVKIPNIDDYLSTRKNNRIDRRVSSHRSTYNASIVDILMDQKMRHYPETLNDEEESKATSQDYLYTVKKSPSLPDDEFPLKTFNKIESIHSYPKSFNPNESNGFIIHKRKKYSEKKFATESEIKKKDATQDAIIVEQPGYQVEHGRELGIAVGQLFTPLSLKLEYSQDDYFTNFYGLPHIHFICHEKTNGPTLISVLMEKEIIRGEAFHRVLIKNHLGDQTLWIENAKLKTHKKSKSATHVKLFHLIEDKLNHLEGKKTKVVQFLKPRYMEDPELIEDILEYESRMSSNAFKFGVLYAGKEKTEDAMYSLNEPSEAFNEFIDFLGDRIRLKGWNNYSAGLDVDKDRNGKWSVYQRWSTMEIMFHVSTLLPHNPEDPQQIERKKHIGNDIVVIIFQDEDAEPFDPSIMRSWFNHVFIIVRPIRIDGETKYKCSVVSKEGVLDHTPLLPKPAIFEKKPHTFRKFLLTKRKY